MNTEKLPLSSSTPSSTLEEEGLEGRDQTQQTLKTVNTETERPVLERRELLPGTSGAQSWSFFTLTPVTERTAAVGDAWTVTAGAASLQFGNFSLS